jgi:purine-cytosine permease-like protein
LPIERRCIEYIPEDERHGRVIDQGPFWFLSNFQFFAIAIGFVGPSLGLDLPQTALAGTLGILIGTTFQAFHASQGAQLGLPQMLQSRAQFGYRGVVVPLLGVFVSLVGYNVVATVLISDGLAGLWHENRDLCALVVSLLAALLAIWGYDWLHRVFRILFWISLPLFSVLSLAILHGSAAILHGNLAILHGGSAILPGSLAILPNSAGGGPAANGGFTWAAFLTQLASAASFNVTAAPYVSDYSRYLPTRTRRGAIILNVFLGSALSAIWLIVLGAWLATHMGVTDALVALERAGDGMRQGFGAVLVAVSIAALVATIGMNAYSAMLTSVTMFDSFRPVRRSAALRIVAIAGITILWIGVALGFRGDAVRYVNAMLVIMLYFLMPWTAVNLIDYFWLRRGRYSIPDLFTPNGIYGAWGRRGLIAYAVGFASSIPFFVVPDVYTGPLATRLGGVDVGWIVSLASASLAYLCLSRGFDARKEAAVLRAAPSRAEFARS